MDKQLTEVKKKNPFKILIFSYFYNIINNFKIGIPIYILFNTIVNIQYFSLIIFIIINNIK